MISEELDIHCIKDYFKHFGDNFEKDFNSSPIQLLTSVYPEHDWVLWQFEASCPAGFWEDPKNRRSFMTWAAKQLNIKEISDWYKVTYQVKKNAT